MIQTYRTILADKKQLTANVFIYRFKLADPPTISFIPGQYVILFVPQENKEPARRLYSIASPHTLTNEFELLIKLIPNGCASMYFEKLNLNKEVEFQGPAGMFTLQESPREKIALVTGTGYAPVRSMLKSLMIEGRNLKLDKEAGSLKLENPTSILQPQDPASSIQHPAPKFYLFFGFQYYKDVFLFDELKTLQSSILNLKSYICLSREQNLDMIPEVDKQYFLLGRVNNGFEQIILNTKYSILNTDFYLCSGRGVVESLKEYVYQKGAPKEQVFFEKF